MGSFCGVEQAEVEVIVDLLADQREAELESFFMAQGLQEAFNSPGRGWGRRKKINAALASARERGDFDEVLRSGARRFNPAPEAARVSVLHDIPEAIQPGPPMIDPRLLGLHNDIRGASSELFLDGHLAEAIFAAFRSVESRVRVLSGSGDYGRSLMATVFNENQPELQINNAEDEMDRDEQEGFRFLFMGAMQGIRNPKAHKEVVQEDPERAFDYLGFASLLMRRLDDAEQFLKQEDD